MAELDTVVGVQHKEGHYDGTGRENYTLTNNMKGIYYGKIKLCVCDKEVGRENHLNEVKPLG